MTTETTTPDAAAVHASIAPAVHAYLVAKAVALTMREEIDAIYTPIFLAGQFRDADGELVTDPALAYNVEDDDAIADYFADCHAALIAAGYDVAFGYCPALMARTAQREARAVLIDAALPHFPTMTLDAILCSPDGLANLDNYVDLLAKMTLAFEAA